MSPSCCIFYGSYRPLYIRLSSSTIRFLLTERGLVAVHLSWMAISASSSTLDMKDGKVLFNPAPMTELAAALAAGDAAAKAD